MKQKQGSKTMKTAQQFLKHFIATTVNRGFSPRERLVLLLAILQAEANPQKLTNRTLCFYTGLGELQMARTLRTLERRGVLRMPKNFTPVNKATRRKTEEVPNE